MANDVWVAPSVQLWMHKGNGRAEKLLHSWEKNEFQSTLAAQHSKDYEIVVGEYAAALGSRGDYLLLVVPLDTTSLGASTAETEINKLFIEMMDITGVAPDVQLAKVHGYGKYSPFDSPDLKVSDEMKRGIEAEKLSVLNNNGTTASYTSQYVAGVLDSRIQAKFATTPTTLVDNTYYLRLKPGANDVFMVRYDSRVWLLPTVNTTTNAFYET